MRRGGDSFGQQLQEAALHLVDFCVQRRASEMIGQDVMCEAGVSDVWASVPLLKAGGDAEFSGEGLRAAVIVKLVAFSERASMSKMARYIDINLSVIFVVSDLVAAN